MEHRQHNFRGAGGWGLEAVASKRGCSVPQFFIRARDGRIHHIDDGAEYPSAEAALKLGVRGAAAIALDELAAGKQSAAVEVSIELKDGTCILCSVVSLSVSSLTTEYAQGLDSVDEIAAND